MEAALTQRGATALERIYLFRGEVTAGVNVGFLIVRTARIKT
jgi:hypothetical protein